MNNDARYGILKSIKHAIIGKKPESECKFCRRPIFDINTVFGIRDMCVYCYDAYEQGATKKEVPEDFKIKLYTEEEINRELTIDMIKDGYYKRYDKLLGLYRLARRR